MESEILQQAVKTRKRELSPEKEFLRRFGKLPKSKLPDFESMEKEKIIAWIDQHYRSKEVLTKFIKSVYMVVQELYLEASNSLEKDENLLSFPILEGTVTIDFSSNSEDRYLFTPNKTLESLLEGTDKSGTTKLKEFLDSRFYKMIEALYKLYN